MNLTISPQVRLLAIVALVAVAFVMSGLYFVTRAQLAAQDEATPAPVVQRPAATGPATAAKPKTSPAGATTVKPAAPTQTRATKIALLVKRGVPRAVARELQDHRVVVVALVVPGAKLDATVLAEAQAGATETGVGFVAINVLKERNGRALAKKLGVIQTPAVVVFRRPAKVFVRIDGFADRELVAQAAVNAFRGA